MSSFIFWHKIGFISKNKSNAFFLNGRMLFNAEGVLSGFRVRKRAFLCTITTNFVRNHSIY